MADRQPQPQTKRLYEGEWLTSVEHVLNNPQIVKTIISFLPEASRREDVESSRCVSKFWDKSISDAISCFNLERTRFLLLHGFRKIPPQIMDFEELKRDPLDPNLPPYNGGRGFPGDAFPDPMLKVVGSCNGLVCLLENRQTVLLWNPTTGKSRIFSQKTSHDFEFGVTFYGFGYDYINQSYKIVVGGDVKRDRSARVGYVKRDRSARVDILERETESWRSAKDPNYKDMDCEDAGFYFRGALYWLGEDKGFLSVVRFDLCEEKFQKVYNLLHKDTSKIESPVYFPGATKSCLCYFTMNLETRETTIWKINEECGSREIFSTVCVKDLNFIAHTFRGLHIFDDRYVLLLTSVIREVDDSCSNIVPPLNNVLIVYDTVGGEVVSMRNAIYRFLMYKETSEPVDAVPSRTKPSRRESSKPKPRSSFCSESKYLVPDHTFAPFSMLDYN